MLRIDKKIAVYFFLVFPFIEPGIFAAFQSMEKICTVYDMWLLASILVILIYFFKSRVINGFNIVILIDFVWLFFSTLFGSKDVVLFVWNYGSILALCFLICICFKRKEEQYLIKVITNLLEVYLIVNTITVFMYAPQGGLVTDIETARMKSNYYFLGYDNQHIYYLLPYIALSLVYDELCYKRIRKKTVFIHMIINIATVICWSADTIVAVAFFYILLLMIKYMHFLKLINSYTLIVSNAVVFFFLVIVKISEKISSVIEVVLNKNIGKTREGIWNSYLLHVYKSPYSGYGYMDNKSRLLLTNASHAHNMYLDILFIGGVIGLIIFAVAIYIATNTGRRITDKRQQILFTAIFAYMIAFQATARTYCPTFFLLLALSYELGNYNEGLKTIPHFVRQRLRIGD